MKNEPLAATLAELDKAGIVYQVERVINAHIRVRWRGRFGNRQISISVSPSDHRAKLNARSLVRRYLREDGAI